MPEKESPQREIESTRDLCQNEPVKTLQQIESDVRSLSPQEQEQLREWLENLLEDRLELREEFKAEIEAGKKDIEEGRYRVHKP